MSDRISIEWLARTRDATVRVSTVAPGEGTPWHFHTQVTDYVFALDEGIEVSLRDPEEMVRLEPGGRCDVAPRRVHRVVNRAPAAARYLLVQATGPYDFHEVS